MRITTKGRYGVRAVINLATADSQDPVSIRCIAEQENLFPEFLEQIFYKLKKAGFITSSRGAGGGFKLNKTLEDITVLDILDAVGEDIALTPCIRDVKICPNKEDCPTYDLWEKGTTLIREYFRNISLKDVLEGNKQSRI